MLNWGWLSFNWCHTPCLRLESTLACRTVVLSCSVSSVEPGSAVGAGCCIHAGTANVYGGRRAGAVLAPRLRQFWFTLSPVLSAEGSSQYSLPFNSFNPRWMKCCSTSALCPADTQGVSCVYPEKNVWTSNLLWWHFLIIISLLLFGQT